LCGRYL